MPLFHRNRFKVRRPDRQKVCAHVEFGTLGPMEDLGYSEENSDLQRAPLDALKGQIRNEFMWPMGLS